MYREKIPVESSVVNVVHELRNMMSYNFMSITIKKHTLYYLVLVLVAIIFPLTTYPRIYGVDDFQVMWMANALREGALFSDNTWLIHPASYFGFYPFSLRTIGVPMFLAFLIGLLNLLSFGMFGLPEAILAFNIILIIIIYKSSRNLGNRLFKEEWSRFVFVAAILFSPNIISDTTMTVSTRIIITIVMIALLNLNLKILSNENHNKVKTTFFLFLLLLIGALAHRLWMVTVITIITMIFTLFIHKYKKLQHLTVFLILPISMITFFIGLEFFEVDPLKIWSPFFDNSTLIGVSVNLSIHYSLQIGLILLFFPFGVIIILYKLTLSIKKSVDKKNTQLNIKNQQLLRKNFYLLLFIVPFSFMAPSYYATAIFLPIIIIFSVNGLIYIKKFILNISQKLDWVFPLIFLFLSVGYSLLYVQIYISINLWHMFILMSISLLFYLFVIIVLKYRGKFLPNVLFNSVKLKKGLVILVISISILIFTTTTILGKHKTIDSNPYPWDNRYLTDEEIEIIDYFQNVDINGLIFCANLILSERIAGYGFLPSFIDLSGDGKALYYSFTTPDEVHQNTAFSLSGLSRLYFLGYSKVDPIRILRNTIVNLNVSLEGDLELLRVLNVQYIISKKAILLNEDIFYDALTLNLTKSLPSIMSPVFSTQHLLVWRIY